MRAKAEFNSIQPPTQDTNDLLRAGIAAARAGQSTRARNLLMRAIDQDAKNAAAWLWLSRVLHSLGGRKACLERALALKLTSDKTSRKLTWMRKKLAAELLHKAITAIRAKQWKRAYGLLKHAIGEYKENALDWLQASKAVVGPRLSAIRPAITLWAPVTFILAGTLVVCVSLLIVGSAMAHAAPPPVTIPTHQPSQVVQPTPVQVETPPPTPFPTWTPTPMPVTVEAIAQVIHPTPVLLDPTPVPYPPTRIVIPLIGVDATVVSSTLEIEKNDGISRAKWTVPEYAFAGWHETSVPLGVPGNTVINGHNWPRHAVFRDLYKLQPEDEIVLFSGHISFTYKVTQVTILPEAGQPLEVKRENTRYIQPTDDERITLVTCHPYGSIRDRLVVVALPVEDL